MSKRDVIILVSVVGIFLLLFAVIVGGMLGEDEKDKENNLSQSTATAVPATPPPAKVSIDEIYAQVQTGMAPQQVVAIAKREPDNKSENDFGSGTKYENWSYHSGPGFVSITFNNGLVASKSKY